MTPPPRKVSFSALDPAPEAPGIASEKRPRSAGAPRRRYRYEPDVLREEWCDEGHEGFVLEGDITYEFEDGTESLQLVAGEAFSLPGARVHRGTRRRTGCAAVHHRPRAGVEPPSHLGSARRHVARARHRRSLRARGRGQAGACAPTASGWRSSRSSASSRSRARRPLYASIVAAAGRSTTTSPRSSCPRRSVDVVSPDHPGRPDVARLLLPRRRRPRPRRRRPPVVRRQELADHRRRRGAHLDGARRHRRVVAGYLGGRTDTVVMRGLDVVWSFLVLRQASAVGTALTLQARAPSRRS